MDRAIVLFLFWFYFLKIQLKEIVGFHLHLLVFPFVYQFNSKIVAVVYSSFANDYSSGEHFNIISASF